MKKFLIIIVICTGTYAVASLYHDSFPLSSIKALFPFTKTELSTSDKALKNAFENKIKGFQVGGSGIVIEILPDDNQGSRHQRFILKLDSYQTLLIAHNIDLAPIIEKSMTMLIFTASTSGIQWVALFTGLIMTQTASMKGVG